MTEPESTTTMPFEADPPTALDRQLAKASGHLLKSEYGPRVTRKRDSILGWLFIVGVLLIGWFFVLGTHEVIPWWAH